MAVNRLNGLAVFFALLIGALLGGIAVYKFKPLPEGKVIANQTAIDSLNAFIVFADSVKNIDLTPDTIRIIDTLYLDKERIVYHEPEIDQDSLVLTIIDSLRIEGEIHVWVKFMINKITYETQSQWRYQPVIHTLSTTVEIPVHIPLIQTIDREVIKYSTGHYLSAAMGGNANLFTFGIDYDVVKRDYLYGLQYRRYGDENVYGVKIGINLRTLFKL